MILPDDALDIHQVDTEAVAVAAMDLRIMMTDLGTGMLEARTVRPQLGRI